MKLKGDRVVLRPLLDSDIERLVEIGREPEFRRWWPDLDDENLSEQATGTSGAVVFAITLGDEIIGVAQFSEEDDWRYRHAGIDLGLATAWQNRGLGTDTVRTLVQHLVYERGHHRIVIDPAADNERAIHCYEKAGFRQVGVMRRYERGEDGSWGDGLLMELIADEVL